MKVLIADDSILIRRSLVKLIGSLENVTEISESTNVPETVRLCNENKPDILVLDIRMPGGSGFDVLNSIRDHLDKITVIMLTKYSTSNFREEAEKFNVKYFFDKSNEFEKVLDVIKNYEN